VAKIHRLDFWKDIFRKRPDIIHYFPGPTLKGLLLVRILQLLTRSKTVVSATKPDLANYFKTLSAVVKPNVVIVQSIKSENLFKSVGYRTVFIPNGVDTERFVPVNLHRKMELRRKYGFGERDFIALHIGPVTDGRNQEKLLGLKRVKVLLIVSVTNFSQESLYQELLSKRKDSVICRQYIQNIEEIYAIADAYIFPVKQELNSIDIPLSVLEAMSCNLPVITTHFGALDRVFNDIEGLFFIDNAEQIQGLLDGIRNGEYKIDTREAVRSLSWKKIANDISLVYQSIYSHIRMPND
jgi:glycosyltransferase involved in cell wall biosynthesis